MEAKIIKLYHYKIGFPKHLKTNFGILRLKYGQYALERAYDRMGKVFTPPSHLDTSTAKVIEIESENDKTIKVVYRIPFFPNEDLCLAVLVNSGVVKTIWLNHINDHHWSLKKERYQKP